MKAFFCHRFALPLPDGHRFPMHKYELLGERVRAALPVQMTEPAAATDAELALAHSHEYVARVANGALSAQELRVIGLPWSAPMVERSRRSVGGTVAACRSALAERAAVTLAGGTHHAFADRGQGYCVFNDVAVAIRVLQRLDGHAGLLVAIVDLDVHQGNGTAAIFAGDPSVFTLSLHGATNFPFRKEASCLDVPLADGTGDAEYLDALDAALARMLDRFVPGLIVYVAGADAHEGDRLGKLALTTAGLQARDARVFDLAHRLGVPIAATMAGGYGRDIATTVDVHFNTVASACAHYARMHAHAEAAA